MNRVKLQPAGQHIIALDEDEGGCVYFFNYAIESSDECEGCPLSAVVISSALGIDDTVKGRRMSHQTFLGGVPIEAGDSIVIQNTGACPIWVTVSVGKTDEPCVSGGTPTSTNTSGS